jgi:4-amino-4-deoxy-L-arabinose transferase-like glycosyltransferase
MSASSNPLATIRRVAAPLGPGAVFWLVLTVAVLWIHRPWAPDETRLLSIAWEMWQRDYLLIPVLNDQVYPTQMPMIPWLLIFGWKLLGTHGWWLQILGAVFAFGTVAVGSRMVTYLWMDQIHMPRYLPIILIGSWFWVISMGMSPEATALSFFVCLALLGMLRAWRYGTRGGWLLYGAATGAAVLTSGFVALVYVLPPALLAPLWAGREHALRWQHWYQDLASGVGVALGVVLLWGMFVVNEYGQEYAFAYLYGALPVASALYPRDLPPYAYLLMLFPLLLPWAAWPLPWLRLWQLHRERPGTGTVFILSWVVPALLLLALVADPQPQFLLPLLPAGAMVITYLLLNEELFDQGEDRILVSLAPPLILGGLMLASLAPLLSGAWVTDLGASNLLYLGATAAAGGLLVIVLPRLGMVPRLLLMLVGIFLLAIPILPPIDGIPAGLRELPIWVGAVIAVLGLASGFVPRFHFYGRVVKIAAINVAFAMALLAVADLRLFPSQAMDAPARLLSRTEAEGRPIAHIGDYDGRYTFAARLKSPIEVLTPDQISAWAASHPRGLVVADSFPWETAVSPQLERKTLLDTVRIWSADTLLSAK